MRPTSLFVHRAALALAIALGALLVPRPTVHAGMHAGAPTITVVDDQGTRVVLHGVPRRIVALAPNVVEILYALGIGNRVVGVSQGTTYPPAAAHKPIVVTYTGANLERIVALHPDLLVAAGIDASYLPKLRSLRLPIVVLDPHTMAGILHDITLAGTATGTGSSARTLVAWLQARIDRVVARLRRTTTRPRVYYEYDYDKSGGYTYGTGSFGDNLITLAGGDNIGRAGKTAYPALSPEQIVAAAPQVILLGDAAYGVSAASVRHRPGFSAIPAVAQGRIYPFDDDLVSRPGPRSVDGLEKMARLLHPEAFK